MMEKKRYPNCTNTRYRFINLGHYDANHGWNGSSERTSKRIANSNYYVNSKTTYMDKIKGLFFGADDYVTKPFNPLEVMARGEVYFT